MKKQVTWLLTAVLATSGVSLAACGGSSGSAGGEGNGGAEQQQEQVDPKDKFVGEWKFACAQMEGVTVAGDVSQLLDTDASMGLSLKDDGTGSMSLGDEDGNLTWELASDDSITITPIPDETDEAADPITATYDAEKSAIAVDMSDEDMAGILFFTADGTIEGALDVDLSKATAVSSISQIVGDWKLAGAGMGGLVMYGSADDLSNAFGSDDFDASISVADDGTLTLGGDETGTLTESDGGLTMSDEYSSWPLKMLDDYLVLDMSDLMGIEFFMLYTK